MPLRFACGIVVYLRESYDAAGVKMQDALLAHLFLADSPCRSAKVCITYGIVGWGVGLTMTCAICSVCLLVCWIELLVCWGLSFMFACGVAH